jgi:hypothetical protein
MYTESNLNEYLEKKGITPGTILWSSEIDPKEDSIRSGAKNHPSADFLRWVDIGKELIYGAGRIPKEEWSNHEVIPGKGISMFIKKILPEGMKHVEEGPATNSRKKQLKQDFNPLVERYWWKIEHGQTIPVGLELVFDGVPPGHCTLSVNRAMTVKGFLSLVSQINFESAGCDLLGIAV